MGINPLPSRLRKLATREIMKFKIMKKLAGIGLILACAAGSLSAQRTAAISETELRTVVENFRTSLIKKDKPLFLSLFLTEGNIAWQTVTEDTSLARIKARQPNAVKVFIDPKETYLTFIDFITTDPKPTEETFSDVKISTDGEAAAIEFDYMFLYDRRQTNHGREHWLLVRTENGWKIISVVWSTILPSIEKKINPGKDLSIHVILLNKPNFVLPG